MAKALAVSLGSDLLKLKCKKAAEPAKEQQNITLQLVCILVFMMYITNQDQKYTKPVTRRKNKQTAFY